MRLLVQRVKRGSVRIKGEIWGEIGKGYVCFVGFKRGEREDVIEKMVRKLLNLRIFEDSEGKMNLSIKDVKGEILIVSQFTLYANTDKGNRPSFFEAEEPERARILYNKFLENLKQFPVKIAQGVFGEKMEVEIINDGPVTIMMEVE